MALCHLVRRYGLDLPALPFPVPDFIGISSWYPLGRKFSSVVALAIPLPMLFLAQGTIAIVTSLVAGAFGIGILAFIKDSGGVRIPTSVISAPVGSIRRCVPDLPDVVSADLGSTSRNKITMPGFSKSDSTPYECSLPEQILSNSKCSLRPSKIAEISANTDITFNYDEVVNMQDVTKLRTLEFSNKYEVCSG